MVDRAATDDPRKPHVKNLRNGKEIAPEAQE
jgi:hypothetical protein